MNLRWWIFTKPEQDQIGKIFERRGERAAAAYCRKIGKSWSCSSISKFFHKERVATAAQEAEVRKHTIRSMALFEIYMEEAIRRRTRGR